MVIGLMISISLMKSGYKEKKKGQEREREFNEATKMRGESRIAKKKEE